MIEKIKNNYLNYIKSNKYFLTKKKHNKLRIATYNIHYWTDVWENNSLNKIIKDIKYIDADIIFLQEVIFGVKYKIKNKIINTENVISIFNKLGYIVYFCNILPTWYNGIYGNMMCVKNIHKDKVFDDTNFTFSKSKNMCSVSGNKNTEKETRCYIKIEFDNLIIVGTHLDVCSEKERVEQINIIIRLLKKSKKKLIICGDFNTTDINQYDDKVIKKNILTHVYNNNYNYMNNENIFKYLYNNKFKSVTRNINVHATVWSGIQCDYIFSKNIENIYPQVLYTKNSDHIPIIVDIDIDI